MEGAHRIWLKQLGKRPPKEKEGKQALYDVRYAFLDRLKEINPEILAGDFGATLSRRDLETLLEKFKKKSGVLNAGLRTFVSRALRQGKEKHGWQVSVPPILVDLPREKARFTPESFLGLQKLRRIEHAMFAANSGTATETPQLRIAQLLLSAVLFGGLVHREWLMPWVLALRERVRVGGSILWLDMELAWQYERQAAEGTSNTKKRSPEKRIVRQRRWFADPVTKLLIERWFVSFGGDVAALGSLTNPWDTVASYLKNLDLPLDDRPQNLHDLLAAARTRLGLHVPGYLASFAEGRLVAVSVPPATWTRLCQSKAVLTTRMGDSEDAVPGQEMRRVVWGGDRAGDTFVDQKKILLALRRVVSRKGKGATQCEREISNIIDQQREQLYPIVGFLASWSRYLLKPKKGNTPSTVNRYLGAVADKLLIACGPEDILEWSPGEFVESYERVLELVKNQSEKGFARDTLGRFHRYLGQMYHVHPIGDGFFRGRSAPAEVRVDANLVTQREFDLVKEALGFCEAVFPNLGGNLVPTFGTRQVMETGKPGMSRSAVVCLLTAILGFRCGLRRNEARYLRLIDVHDDGRAELIVRPTRARRLKSPSATRRIPLYALLQPDELWLLLHWKACRLKEENRVGLETLLFCSPGLPTTSMPEVKVFSTIREALATVTGDATLRYHHLRHSFATWLLVRVTGKSTELRQEAPFLDHQEFDDDRISMIREQLLGNEHLGRKGAYLVAALCGHAEVSTTFESYIHLSDWLLCRELSRGEVLPAVSPDVAVRLTGISRALAYRYTQRDAAGTVRFDWESAFTGGSSKLARYRDPLAKQATDSHLHHIVVEDDVDHEIPLWMTVSKVLYMAQAETRSVEEICSKLDLPQSAVERWIDNAGYIGRILTRTSNLRHMQIKSDQGLLGKKIKRKTKDGIFPSPLVYDHDRRVAIEILSTFGSLTDMERRAILEIVDYFLEKFSVQSGMMCFHEIPKALRYVDALRMLGISNSMIRMIDCHGNDPSAKVTRERRINWQKGLNLEARNWYNSYKKWGRVSSHGTVGIQVVTKANGMAHVTYGFRYAIYMIAIVTW